MQTVLTAKQHLDRDFLEMRRRVLDLAAALDRMGSAAGADAAGADPRAAALKTAVGVLIDGKPDRARRVQMVFSDPYDAGWRGEKSKV
ncbi:MAG: hypothetical protein C4547_05135 [Phycisphaerales bacterium]|nr:MAG: hypothetical protein C4547_05135 [Phycisphaerales bacterium]